jgi:hypothetical protein
MTVHIMEICKLITQIKSDCADHFRTLNPNRIRSPVFAIDSYIIFGTKSLPCLFNKQMTASFEVEKISKSKANDVVM